MNHQCEIPIVGDTEPPKHRHGQAEILACRGLSDAVWLSVRHAQMSQEALAHRIHVTPAYLSMMLNGRRPWQAAHLQRIRRVTGSLATLQWAAMREGLDLYADPVEVRKAQLRAELVRLEAA